MSILKMMRPKDPEPEPDLEGWPAEIGAGYGPMPPEAYRDDTLGIFDELLWHSRGIYGGPEALFDAVHSELSGETQAWLATHKLPLHITAVNIKSDSVVVSVARHRAEPDDNEQENDDAGENEG